jgi:hypothetical protein
MPHDHILVDPGFVGFSVFDCALKQPLQCIVWPLIMPISL